MSILNQRPGILRTLKEYIKRSARATPKRRYTRQRGSLELKAGEWVEVRSRREILATLDERGRLDNLPFMPEMLTYCGQRFRVFKRADKTCDNIASWSIRRVKDCVHLEATRCDGAGHGDCEAGCLIFWKEAWLKRLEDGVVPLTSLQPAATVPAGGSALCTIESILAASRASTSGAELVYSCQSTEVLNFTSYMASWDPRQYIRDLRSGNLASGLAGDSRMERALEIVLSIGRLLPVLIIPAFNRLQSQLDGARYPFIAGTLAKTPVATLDLQPGELVQVRSREEIMATLNKDHRNRGLLFDSEMLPYCGQIYRVLRRVYRIIDEKTGKMMNMKYPCIVLEGVVCRSDYHRLCPRAIYSYWRENWLKRVSPNVVSAQDQELADCHRN